MGGAMGLSERSASCRASGDLASLPGLSSPDLSATSPRRLLPRRAPPGLPPPTSATSESRLEQVDAARKPSLVSQVRDAPRRPSIDEALRHGHSKPSPATAPPPATTSSTSDLPPFDPPPFESVSPAGPRHFRVEATLSPDDGKEPTVVSVAVESAATDRDLREHRTAAAAAVAPSGAVAPASDDLSVLVESVPGPAAGGRAPRAGNQKPVARALKLARI